MWTLFVGMVFGGCVGFMMAIALEMAGDRHLHEELEQMIANPENWCADHCKLWEKCHMEHHDASDAIHDLIDHYCPYCPVSAAMEKILRDEARKEREAIDERS